MNTTNRSDRTGIDADSMIRTGWVGVHKQGFSFEHTGSQEGLSALLADLQAAGQNITLEKLRDYRIQETPIDALTDRQREVLEVAYEREYYDVPRGASAVEVAAELGVDDSTVAEHLQRAERNLLASFLD